MGNTSPQLGQEVLLDAWVEKPSQIQTIDTFITIYAGTSSIYRARVDANTHHLRVNLIFDSPGQTNLKADPDLGPDSFLTQVTAFKFQPVQNILVSETKTYARRQISISTSSRLYRPNGTIAFYVKPPGGQWTIFAQKAVSSSDPNFIDTDVRQFAFTGAYQAPGEYVFSVGYLGDALNIETRWREAKVQVGAFNPAVLVPVMNLLLN